MELFHGGPGSLFWAGNIIGIIFGIIQFFVFLALYILGAVGLYTIASRRKIELSWLAFIPLAQFYLVGIMIKKLKILDFDIPRLELVLPLAPLSLIVLRWIPYVGGLANTAVFVLIFAAFYNLFKQYRDEKTSLIYTIFAPLFLFVIKDAMPVNAPDSYQPAPVAQPAANPQPQQEPEATVTAQPDEPGQQQ